MAGTETKGTWQTAVDLDFTAAITAQDVMDAPSDSTRRLKITSLFISLYETADDTAVLIVEGGGSELVCKLACDVIKQGDIPLAPDTGGTLDASTKEIGFDLPANTKLQARVDKIGAKVQITAVGRIV